MEDVVGRERFDSFLLALKTINEGYDLVTNVDGLRMATFSGYSPAGTKSLMVVEEYVAIEEEYEGESTQGIQHTLAIEVYIFGIRPVLETRKKIISMV